MKTPLEALLAAVDVMAIASDAALRVPRDESTEAYHSALANIDNLIDDLRDSLKEAL